MAVEEAKLIHKTKLSASFLIITCILYAHEGMCKMAGVVELANLLQQIREPHRGICLTIPAL